MKILVAHNRRRSSSPGGEDRVVDQEHEALVDAGHDVEEVGEFRAGMRCAPDFPLRRKALVPLQLLWNQRGDPRPGCRDRGVSTRRCPCAKRVSTSQSFGSPELSTPPETLRRHLPPRFSADLFEWNSLQDRFRVPRLRRSSAADAGCPTRLLRDSAGAAVPIAVATVAHRQLWRRRFCLCVSMGRAAPLVGITEVSAPPAAS